MRWVRFSNMHTNLSLQRAISFLLLPLTIVFFTLFAAVQFIGAGHDDTYIMLWAGKTLLNKGWFVNYNFDFQEIASSISMALVAAASHLLSPSNLLFVYKLISLAFTLVSFLLLYNILVSIFHKHGGVNKLTASIIALGVVISTGMAPSLQYWTFGGLETSLLFLCFVLLLGTLLRFLIYKTWQTTIQLYMVAILLVATRPEGFFYAFGTMLAVLLLFLADLVMDRSKLRRLMLVIGHFA